MNDFEEYSGRDGDGGWICFENVCLDDGNGGAIFSVDYEGNVNYMYNGDGFGFDNNMCMLTALKQWSKKNFMAYESGLYDGHGAGDEWNHGEGNCYHYENMPNFFDITLDDYVVWDATCIIDGAR